MGISDSVDTFERETLAVNPDLQAVHEEFAASGDLRMRQLAARITSPSWPGATSASRLRSAAVEAEITAILDDYAAAAQKLIRPADADRWQALVRDAQRLRGEGLLADELGRSTVGASLLRDGLGGRTTSRPQRGGVDCACGYAVTGILPERLCPECGDLLVRRWVAEERRLLRDLPAYAADVAGIIEDTAQKQTKAITTPGDYRASDAEGRRRSGGRKLARLRRRRRAETAALDLTRWRGFIDPLSRDAREGVRSAAARAPKRGLGAGAMTELAVRGSEELVREMSRFGAAGSKHRR